MSDVRIVVRGLSKRYHRGPEHPGHARIGTALLRPYRRLRGLPVTAPRAPASEFWALQDVTFDVHDGERIGIIGRNGAGKSTLLKILSRIIYPTEGEARIRGRVTSLLEVGTGFNPGLSGRENIYLNASVHGLERKEIDVRFDEIVEFSGIRDFIDTPVKHYSSGMYMRLAFSVAAHLDPDILLLDEVLAVGDLSFQQKCLRRVEGLTAEGRTVLFVSHSMDAITRFCSRCIWLEQGRIIKDGPTQEVTEAYVGEVLGLKSSQQWNSEDDHSAQDGIEPKMSDTSSADDTSATEDRLIINGDGELSESYCTEPMRSRSTDEAMPPVAQQESDSREVTPEPSEPGPPPATEDQTEPRSIGSDDVRIVSARVISEERVTIAAVPMDQRVGIEMTYEVLRAAKPLVPAIALVAPNDALICWAVDTTPAQAAEAKRVGRYVSTTWFPAHLLNSGQYSVTLAIVTPDPMERHFVIERALSFYSVEARDSEYTARGPMARNFPGVIRPRLTWETRHLNVRIAECSQSSAATF